MKTHADIRKVAERYNMVPNILWTVVNLAPVYVFCYRQVPLLHLFIILSAAMVTAFLPARWYKQLQLGRHAAAYRRVGILFIRRFSQDGDLINRILRRRYPNYKVIRDASQNRRYIQRSYMYERYHVAAFVAMLALAVYALYGRQYGWALVIMLNNLLYNIYPVWLQQYNRLRLQAIMNRRS